MFGLTVGGGLFKTFLKCSTQRISCSPSDVNEILFLCKHVGCMIFASDDLRNVMHTRFHIHYVVLIPLPGMQGSPCTSAVSVVARRFTSLSAARYISSYLSLSRRDFESMTFLVNLRLLSIAFQVSGDNHSLGVHCL